MSIAIILSCLVTIAIVGFVFARQKAIKSVGGDKRKLHSLPQFYGLFAAYLAVFPALVLIILWLILQPLYVNYSVISSLPESVIPDTATQNLVMSEIDRLYGGLKVLVASGAIDTIENLSGNLQGLQDMFEGVGVKLASSIDPVIFEAVARKYSLETKSAWILTVLTLGLSLALTVYAVQKAHGQFWARNAVERGTLILLATAASIAIFTSIGIVLSMVFEASRFFSMHPWTDFFFGSSWAPSFNRTSALSILPLLWGTLYISFVALLVAVPIGLFAAIYLSEYASKSVRSIAKPLLEVLAGIPTIVYGLFALITFGPFLRSFFGDGGYLGVAWMGDSRSVLTAGVVMGMMLIPFVSSLSDDIINAVPQAMRDGSYGLGATQSETVRNVILPAALPGIIGAILLAASRAIGETMIVVMGAGAIARYSGNPLEALTTITTRIVSQLTGDLEFDSPETLVAFALGLTLFVITLGLNVLALYIVRKYREQYE